MLYWVIYFPSQAYTRKDLICVSPDFLFRLQNLNLSSSRSFFAWYGKKCTKVRAARAARLFVQRQRERHPKTNSRYCIMSSRLFQPFITTKEWQNS